MTIFGGLHLLVTKVQLMKMKVDVSLPAVGKNKISHGYIILSPFLDTGNND